MPTPDQMQEYIIERKALAVLRRGYTAVRHAYKGNGYWVSINRNGADDVYGETPILALAAAYDALGLTCEESPMTEDTRDCRLVTVCDKCLQASCWHGIFMCDEAVSAGTLDLPVYELIRLNREHPSYWKRALKEG